MKYRLNELPVKTTNGFQINDVEIDIDIPSFQMNHTFNIQGDISSLKITQTTKKESYCSKIGLPIDEYLEVKICVPKDTKVTDPIFISYDFEDKEAIFSNFVIDYENNSSCNFIFIMKSHDDGIHFNHFVEKVTSKENAKGNITFINLLNHNSLSFYALENDVMEHASITHSMIDLGGKTRLYNVFTNLLEYQAMNNLNTIYIGSDDALLDFNYYIKNIGRETSSKMVVEGAIKDQCHKNFRGTIDFIKGCSTSIGEENENCVLLSDTCRSRSLPQLLCEEENVVGSHGVSSGKVSEEKLFYLMSKGYDKRDAEKLIVLGNFNHILNSIPSDELKDIILDKIEKEI